MHLNQKFHAGFQARVMFINRHREMYSFIIVKTENYLNEKPTSINCDTY